MIIITQQHLDIFRRFGGDSDGFDRLAAPEQRAIMTYAHWDLICEFIHNFKLINRKLASDEFGKMMLNKINTHCQDDSTRESIFILSFNP